MPPGSDLPVGLCQLISNWGKVAAEQLKPVISGELMKKVRYRRVSNTAAFSLSPRSHYRRVLPTVAFSLPPRSHYRRVLNITVCAVYR